MLYYVLHTMARKGYTTIALPNNLIEQIEKATQNPQHGYTNRMELIKEAIREKLRQL